MSKRYVTGEGATCVLDRVELELPSGRTAALVGRSGSGKSTLLHLAAGLSEPDSGRVLIGETDLALVPASRRAAMRRRDIGFVFQFFHLLRGLTVEENVALPLVLDGAPGAREAAREMIDRVGLSHRRRHYATDLSGGEMQRAAIARALVIRPTLVLADEPTGNLDSLNSARVLELLHATVSDTGAAMLLVTHDPAVATSADRTFTMADGRLS